MRVSAAIMKGARGACCPSCRRPQLPPAGAGRVAAQCPSFGRWLPQSAAARCTPYAPLSVGAVGWSVGCPGWSVALPASGLIVDRGCSPGWSARVGAGRWSGLLAGLVGSRRGWSCVVARCGAGFFSEGLIILNVVFSIVGLFLPSVGRSSLPQSVTRPTIRKAHPARGY